MPGNLTDAGENAVLDYFLVDGDKLALMSVLGTDAAAGTEVAGGSYARQVIDWANASGGSKATAADITFAGMPATEVQGWAVFDSTGATRKCYGLWNTKIGTATASTDLITVTAHGLTDGTKIVFQSGYAPAGLTANTTYYVRDSTSNTFKVSATLGGSAIDITADLATVALGVVRDIAAGSSATVATGTLVVSAN